MNLKYQNYYFLNLIVFFDFLRLTLQISHI